MCIALSAFDAAPKIKRIERKEMLNVNCCYGQRETYIVGVKKGCPYSSLNIFKELVKSNLQVGSSILIP